jgi:hypothetical protein
MQPTDKKLYDQVVASVKASVAHWPSAYASGMVVQRYKKLMQSLGKEPYLEDSKPATKNLSRWYKEKWIDISTGKPCGSVKTDTYYPVCRPSVKVTSATPVLANELTASQKKKAIAAKQVAKNKTIKF